MRILIASARRLPLLSSAFGESGDEVRTTGVDASAVLRAVARTHPAVMVVDITDDRGIETVRAVMTYDPCPIVALTAAHERDRAGQVRLAGAATTVEFSGRSDELPKIAQAAHLMAGLRVVRQRPRTGDHEIPEQLVPAPVHTAALVAIAASTGGPEALKDILGSVPCSAAPILIVQHIGAGFEPSLADWLDRSSELAVTLAVTGTRPAPGHAYIAPAGAHLGVTPDDTIALSPAPAIRSHRPSATHLFRTAAVAAGPSLLAVVLTGMGGDGVEGLQDVRSHGGRVVAQDEATSAVYGMPREAALAGLVNQVLPLSRIGPAIAAWHPEPVEV